MLAAQARSTSAADGIVEQREQQVLDGDELVALLARLDEGHVQTDFQFLRDHASSITHCSGCWRWRAQRYTSSTFVAAMSLRDRRRTRPRPRGAPSA
jgi:hypothetical protein